MRRREQLRKLESLLEEERRDPGPSAEVRDRVGGRVEATLGTDIGKAQLLEHRIARAPRPPLRLVPKVARPALASLIGFAPMALAGLGAVGVASGIVYVSLPHEVTARVRRVPVPAPRFGLPPGEFPPDPHASVPLVPPGSDPSVSAGAGPAAATTVPRRHTNKVGGTAAPIAPARDLSLAEESALLEEARSDLLRGSEEQALWILGTHEHRFPTGRLVEQREALTIQALVHAGRRDEASRRAKEFRDRFPGSLMLQVIESALQGEEP